MVSRFVTSEFEICHIKEDISSFGTFHLHNHIDKMEILVMYEGDAEFHIEGNIYPLEKNDIIIVQHGELHKVVMKSLCHYDRLFINIDTSFFGNQGCEQFKDVFLNRTLGEQNLIKHTTVESKEIHEIMDRLQKYAFTEAPETMVVTNTLIELLYILNLSEIQNAESTARNNNIRNIILYINENITKPLNLEHIASKFFMSKYHMCRIFKKYTGFTVNQYITQKRIALAKDLAQKGNSLTFAASEAGFKSYSSFYRAYLKENGLNPKSKF